VVDRPLGEEVAGGEPGVTGADDDRGEALDVVPPCVARGGPGPGAE
jgi:hypothetical protein